MGIIPEEIYKFEPGVLNPQQIIILKEREIIQGLNDDDPESLDGSAFDLHLSEFCVELEGSRKCLDNEPIDEIINSCIKKELNLSESPTLEVRHTYLAQLRESVYFEKYFNLYGRATGKSSIGRLDVLARLMVDNSSRYDYVPSGHTGKLWVLITPNTFSIKIKDGIPLNQLRIFRDEPEISRLAPNEHKLRPVCFLDLGGGSFKPTDKLSVSLKPIENGPLAGASAFVTKQRAEIDGKVIDLTLDNEGSIIKHNPKQYWDKVETNKQNLIKIEPDRFYILKSKERILLHDDIAVYCRAMSEDLGELRIHYAGFVHPLFGQKHPSGSGAPLIFELRGYCVPALLKDGEILADVEYYGMSDNYEGEGLSDYDDQELKLSKYFDDWKD